MKEFMFRGKDAVTAKWIFGYFLRRDKGDSYGIIDEDGTEHSIMAGTEGQYTTLKDCGFHEIFVGDLLRFPPKDDWENENFTVYEVFFHHGDCADSHVGFQMNRTHYHGAIAGGSIFATMLPKWTERMVKIGNVYDNPELTKR